ncbi:MAG TPA: choice-of-anchor X domain-containing protein [Candidatus Thermoplasmatota archaeon]|nr:choice-of-anchor X domain-containing protein [Candidatus Thermoplasmatota archaeon]
MMPRSAHGRDRFAERRPRRALGDDALSDVVATMLLVGVTASLVAGASLGLVSTSGAPLPPSGLALAAAALEGSDHVTLVHAGGETFSGGSLRVVVTVDGRKAHDAPLAAERFGLGDAVAVPVAQTLALGGAVSVAVIDVARGHTLATAELDVSGAVVPRVDPPPAFTMRLRVLGAGSPIVLAPPAEILVEADVSHEAGRKNVRHVYVDLTSMKGPAWAALRDDGAGGDRLAGDGVWGALVLVPRDVSGGSKTLDATAIDFDGRRATASVVVELVRRLEATEESANPTSTPMPDARTCPGGTGAVAGYRYGISGAAAADLGGAVRPGDHVTAYVTIAPGCANVTVSLVTYRAPSAAFSWETAGGQTLFDSATAVLGPGEHALEVDVPDCHFQVSLVLGLPIVAQGPEHTNNFYSRQNRLLDADNGGDRSCVSEA